MPRPRLFATLGVGVLGLALAGTAAAVPVSNFRASVADGEVSFTATLNSPTNARNCTADVSATLRKNVAPNFAALRRVTGTVNVCRTGKRGVTRGYLRGNFNLRTVPHGSYGVCITATQPLRTGATSRDSACRIFSY
jgi:hypothetical protein